MRVYARAYTRVRAVRLDEVGRLDEPNEIAGYSRPTFSARLDEVGRPRTTFAISGQNGWSSSTPPSVFGEASCRMAFGLT